MTWVTIFKNGNDSNSFEMTQVNFPYWNNIVTRKLLRHERGHESLKLQRLSSFLLRKANLINSDIFLDIYRGPGRPAEWLLRLSLVILAFVQSSKSREYSNLVIFAWFNQTQHIISLICCRRPNPHFHERWFNLIMSTEC